MSSTNNKKSGPNCKDCPNSSHNIFCMIQGDKLDELADEKTYTKYSKGEFIFKEGTRPFGIFCLNSGKVKLVKAGEDGRNHILRLHRQGDLLGYRSLFSETGYNASAIALEECQICFIPRELFLKFIKEDSDLAFELLKMLSDDLKRADTHLTNLAQKPVRERAAEALIFIQETYGFADDGKTIDAIFTREDIANIVGTATETIIRVLSDFNKEGAVMLKGKKIIIPDIQELRRISNSFD